MPKFGTLYFCMHNYVYQCLPLFTYVYHFINVYVYQFLPLFSHLCLHTLTRVQWRSWVGVDARAHLNVGGASGRVSVWMSLTAIWISLRNLWCPGPALPLLVFPYVYTCLTLFTPFCSWIPIFSCVYLCLLVYMFSYFYPCLLVFTYYYSLLPKFTCV